MRNGEREREREHRETVSMNRIQKEINPVVIKCKSLFVIARRAFFLPRDMWATLCFQGFLFCSYFFLFFKLWPFWALKCWFLLGFLSPRFCETRISRKKKHLRHLCRLQISTASNRLPQPYRYGSRFFLVPGCLSVLRCVAQVHGAPTHAQKSDFWTGCAKESNSCFQKNKCFSEKKFTQLFPLLLLLLPISGCFMSFWTLQIQNFFTYTRPKSTHASAPLCRFWPNKRTFEVWFLLWVQQGTTQCYQTF